MIAIRSDLGDGSLPDEAWPEMRALLEKYAGPTPIESLRPRGARNVHKRLDTPTGAPATLCAPEARGLNFEAIPLANRDDLVTCQLCLAAMRAA